MLTNDSPTQPTSAVAVVGSGRSNKRATLVEPGHRRRVILLLDRVQRTHAEVQPSQQIRFVRRLLTVRGRRFQILHHERAVRQCVLMVSARLIGLQCIVKRQPQFPLQPLPPPFVVRSPHQLARGANRVLRPIHRIQLALRAGAGGQRLSDHEQTRRCVGPFMLNQILRGMVRGREPLGDDTLLLLPIAPGDVVRYTQIRLDQHLLRRATHVGPFRFAVRLRRLDRRQVKVECSLVIAARVRPPSDRPSGTKPWPWFRDCPPRAPVSESSTLWQICLATL